MRRIARMAAIAAVLMGAGVWIAGAALALSAAQPPGCKWPYRIWAAAWPVFLVLPDAGRTTFVEWSFLPCRRPIA